MNQRFAQGVEWAGPDIAINHADGAKGNTPKWHIAMAGGMGSAVVNRCVSGIVRQILHHLKTPESKRPTSILVEPDWKGSYTHLRELNRGQGSEWSHCAGVARAAD